MELNPREVRAPEEPSGGLWPACSRAEVVFYWGERRDAARTSTRLFGRRLKRWEYAGLAGAPDDARVNVGTLDGRLWLEMYAAEPNCYGGVWLVWRVRSDVVIVNDAFHIHRRSMRRKGLGLRIFNRQLDHAGTLGVARIETVAGRRENENGYYTWPRFGFDGPLGEETRQNLPRGLQHAQTVLDLMQCETGRRWWKQHGKTIRVAFDLAECSRCRCVFDRYVYHRLRLTGPARLEQEW